MLKDLSCETIEPRAEAVDEVCFFRPAAASQVAGAPIRDGFMVRKDDHVALIGTGIAIRDADDPLAEAVVRTLQGPRRLPAHRQRGAVRAPAAPRLTPEQLSVFARRAVLLVQLEHRSSGPAVLYGYLAPVNVFGSLSAE